MKIEYLYLHKKYYLNVDFEEVKEHEATTFSSTLRTLELCHDFVLDFKCLATKMDAVLFFIVKKALKRESDLEMLEDFNFRQDFISSINELYLSCEEIKKNSDNDSEKHCVLYFIFLEIVKKLDATTLIFLEDYTYQEKIKYRQRKLDTQSEIFEQSSFETTLLQMTDIANVLKELLTEKQRERLVKHIFLGYSMKEIADQEQVKAHSVSESLSVAMQCLKNYYKDNCK